MLDSSSPLQQARLKASSQAPALIAKWPQIDFTKDEMPSCIGQEEEIQTHFSSLFNQPLVSFKESTQKGLVGKKLRVGVVFSGGQAPGGHNVICGLFDAIKRLHAESTLIGFLEGPKGILKNQSRFLTEEELALFRNMGGFDLLGSGRDKIEKEQDLQLAMQTCQQNQLDALIIIGGDDSNTNAALLAEYFLKKKQPTQVIGVPKTIDGDLQNSFVDISFGFDTACRVYSEMIGNIARDCLSAKKYTHFIKLMGRSASHIALECALQIHPNVALIGEEIAARGQTLQEITDYVADILQARSSEGKDYGVVLVPEGLIEFVPEIGALISELNEILTAVKAEEAPAKLSFLSKRCFDMLPPKIQNQLLLDRDPHGNVQVAQIETEALLMHTVGEELAKRRTSGDYKGTFSPISHYFGYEGRCSLPSHFDSDYCYCLGYSAALLVHFGFTGYMCFVKNLSRPVKEWEMGGVPLVCLMNMEKRKGVFKPVIQKALVDLNGKAFNTFAVIRQHWALQDDYRFPGPIQFFGDESFTHCCTFSLALKMQK